jgi:hypothetical protein
MRRAVGYGLLFVWTAMVCSLQLVALGLAPHALAQPGDDAAMLARMLVPDLATVLLVAAVGRLARRDLVAIALTVALSRMAFTAASPFAVLAGTIAVAFIADVMRRFAELDRPVLRVLSTGAGAFVYVSWLLFVDVVRAGEAGAHSSLDVDASGAGAVTADALLWPVMTAFTTALIAFSMWPLFRNLPGLARLERRAF